MCTDDFFTVRAGKSIKKINKINFDLMLTLKLHS